MFERPFYVKNFEDEFKQMSKGLIKEFKVTYKDLLESHAHIKSLFDLFCFYARDKNNYLINRMIKEDRLFPFEYRDGKIIFDFIGLKYRSSFIYPFYMFLQTTSFNWGKIVEYINKDFPNPRGEGYIECTKSFYLYTLVLEAAVTIPSPMFIFDAIVKGKYILDDFNPVIRFYKILLYLYRLDYDSIMLYKTGDIVGFMDVLSHEYSWPDYYTIKKSYYYLYDYANTKNISMSRFITLIKSSFNKKSSSNALFALPYIATMDVMKFPIVCRRKKQTVIVFCDINNKEDGEVAMKGNLYDFMYGDDSNDGNTPNNKFYKDVSLIVENLFRKAVVDKVLLSDENYFACPLSEFDCPCYSLSCKKFLSMQMIVDYVYKISLQGRKCLFWDFIRKYNLNSDMKDLPLF